MPKTKIKPSRWYYVVAGTALVTGGAVFAVFLLNGVSGLTEGLTQIVVPGRHELILSETGRYTVFHEYRSVVENRVYSMPKIGLSGLQCDLAFEATGFERTNR